MANFYGTTEPDSIIVTGTDPENWVYALEGADLVTGSAAIDYIRGGLGNDTLLGGAGDDWLHGQEGRDILDGGDGEDSVSYYESLAPVIVSLDGSLKATGDAAGDLLLNIEDLGGSEKGSDKLAGDEFDNRIYGEGGNDLLLGKGGFDTLFGMVGKDTLIGGTGDDWLVGGPGADSMIGGAGEDGVSYYESGRVTMSLDGSFKARGEAKGDVLKSIENIEGSDSGADKLAGDGKGNSIWGQGGNDIIYGRAGNDWLGGGDGDDKIFGEKGSDTLAGNGGNDTLTGGAGNDTFALGGTGYGVDTITDFTQGERISFNTTEYGHAAGAISQNEFEVNSTGLSSTADVRFIYNSANSILYYDADGNGTGAASVAIAIIQNHYSGFTAANFLYAD